MFDNIRKSVDEVNSCVEALLQRDITQTWHIVQSNERQLHAIRHNTKMSEVEMRNMSKQIEEVKEHMQEISERSLAGVNALFNFLMDYVDGAYEYVDSRPILERSSLTILQKNKDTCSCTKPHYWIFNHGTTVLMWL